MKDNRYIRVRPVDDAVVLNPSTWRPLSKRGDRVPNSPYWQLQIKRGLIETFDRPAATANPKTDTSATGGTKTSGNKAPVTKADTKPTAKPEGDKA